MARPFSLGKQRPVDGRSVVTPFNLPPNHLVTHAVVVGMTGSGKTGLLFDMIEEAALSGVGVLGIDIKADFPNIALTIPSFSPQALEAWIEPPASESVGEVATKLAEQRKQGLEEAGIDESAMAEFVRKTKIRILTPGSEAGEPLHVLSALAVRSVKWDEDVEGARASLSATVSLILRLLGRDADPTRSPEHVLLAVLAEKRLSAGQPADIEQLISDVIEPPVQEIGVLTVDEFMSRRARKDLASALNTLLASPTFQSWRQGATLDVGAWMAPVSEGGQTKAPITIVSVAHLDDDERALVLGILLEEVLSWVRSLPGTQRLRSLVVFDEVYGFLPPHPASPPTKRPLVALMKQARAYGVGLVIATQNPMDLDYRALSNAGFWALGRLQTDADRERVLDGLANEAGRGESAEELATVLKQLRPRWFVVRDAHTGASSVLLRPRWAMSFMRGPMTRHEIRRLRLSLAGASATTPPDAAR